MNTRSRMAKISAVVIAGVAAAFLLMQIAIEKIASSTACIQRPGQCSIINGVLIFFGYR